MAQKWCTWIILVFGAFLIAQTILCAAEIPPAAIATAPNATIPADNSTGTNVTSSGAEKTANKPGNDDLLRPPEVSTIYESDTPTLDEIAGISKSKMTNQSLPQNQTKPKPGDTEVNDLNKKIPLEEFEGGDGGHGGGHKDTDADMDLARKVFTNNTFGLPDNADVKTVEKSEDVVESQSGGNEDDHEANSESLMGQKIMLDDGPLVTPVAGGMGGQIPAIVAGIFVILCVVGYTAMLMWRRYLENKYGNREMLVNEEFDPNDMRHFSL